MSAWRPTYSARPRTRRAAVGAVKSVRNTSANRAVDGEEQEREEGGLTGPAAGSADAACRSPTPSATRAPRRAAARISTPGGRAGRACGVRRSQTPRRASRSPPRPPPRPPRQARSARARGRRRACRARRPPLASVCANESCDAVGTSRRRSACAKAARIGAGAAPPLETQSSRRSAASGAGSSHANGRSERRAAEPVAERHRARCPEAEVGRAGAARASASASRLRSSSRETSASTQWPARARRPAARGPAAPPVAAARRSARAAARPPPRARRVGGSERLVGDQLEAHAVVLFARVLQRREEAGSAR